MKNKFIILSIFLISLLNGQTTPQVSDTGLIQPKDIKYIGAFRLPDNENFDWGQDALTYFDNGDLNGGNDSFPGSLYIVGRDLKVSEISIPIPKNSKDINTLNRAKQLQSPSNITGNIYSTDYPQMQIVYIDKQSSQTTGKIHTCFSDWYNVADIPIASLGWHETNLSNPNSKGPWYLGNVNPHSICDYMFEIPKNWSDKYMSGIRLATGKQRQGGRGGVGPSIHAYSPWLQGNPPLAYTKINAHTLLKYAEPDGIESQKFSGHSVGDVWKGGAWLSNKNSSAVMIVGQKGLGGDFYGDMCGEKGYHPLGGYKAVALFYNTNQLAEVAQGKRNVYNLQPYNQIDLSPYIFRDLSNNCSKPAMGGVAYDRNRGLIYISTRAEGMYKERPVILVFKLDGGGSSVPDTNTPINQPEQPKLDTTKIYDTIQVYDTNIVNIYDTLITIDTNIINVFDTTKIEIFDTTTILDTINIIDTSIFLDTNIIDVFDTIQIIDTIKLPLKDCIITKDLTSDSAYSKDSKFILINLNSTCSMNKFRQIYLHKEENLDLKDIENGSYMLYIDK